MATERDLTNFYNLTFPCFIYSRRSIVYKQRIWTYWIFYFFHFRDVNGILVFFKKTALSEENENIDLITMGFQNLDAKSPPQLYPRMVAGQPDYENLKSPSLPLRPAPKPPATVIPPPKSNFNTLGPCYSELDGIPFKLSPQIKKTDPLGLDKSIFITQSNRDYDFTLERQVLCTTKAITNKNPFFQWTAPIATEWNYLERNLLEKTAILH